MLRSAFAAPINGTIDIFVGIVPLNTPYLATATGTGSSYFGLVSPTSSGDFAPYAFSLVQYNAFILEPGQHPHHSSCGASGPASFDLLSLNIDTHTATDLDLSGNGVLHLNGFDDTPGSWTYQITTTNTKYPQQIFIFQSSNTASSGSS